jgi:uncharacterized protein YkvS
MRATREVVFGERRITVRELTVGEIRAWLAGLEARVEKLGAVDLLLVDDLSLPDLTVFCDLGPEDVEALTQSELAALTEAARELNPRFFSMLARLEELGRRATEV